MIKFSGTKKIKNFFNYSTYILLILAILIPAVFVNAADGTGGGGGDGTGGGGNQNPAGLKIVLSNPFNCGKAKSSDCTVYDLLVKIVDDILIPIGAVVAVLMIMWAGFLYVTARGNTTQIENAKKALLWAVIGAAILLGAKVIAGAIKATIEQLK